MTKKDRMLKVRVTEEDMEALRTLASGCSMSVSAYVLDRALAPGLPVTRVGLMGVRGQVSKLAVRAKGAVSGLAAGTLTEGRGQSDGVRRLACGKARAGGAGRRVAMAMLKTMGQGHAESRAIHRAENGARLEVDESGGKTGHVGSCKNIDNYLWEGPRNVDAYLERGKGHEGRPLAFRHTDELDFEGEHGWWRVMDEERRAWGKIDGRTYYHFVVSPDPRDHVGADELADVALEWVRRCLPGTQAVVSVHDDNEGHIMHAHVVVNSVIPSTGKKIHRTDADVRREAEVCQELCREHGLAAMPSPRERRRQAWSAQWAKAEAAERRIETRGGRSWKADIRRAVDECVREATTWRQFVRAMGARGFQVRETRRGDLTYYHPDSTGSDKRVRACRLGMGYDAAGGEGSPRGGLRDARRRRCGLHPPPCARKGPQEPTGEPDRAPLTTSELWADCYRIDW